MINSQPCWKKRKRENPCGPLSANAWHFIFRFVNVYLVIPLYVLTFTFVFSRISECTMCNGHSSELPPSLVAFSGERLECRHSQLVGLLLLLLSVHHNFSAGIITKFYM